MSNKLNFVLTDSMEGHSIDFTWKKGDYAIGPKGGFDTVHVKKNKNELEIDVESARHGSTDPVTPYRNFVHNDESHMIHTEHGSCNPDELNFAIWGTLTIDGKAFQVCMGQGHYASTNNWHLCSESIDGDTDHKGGYLGDQYYLSQSGSHDFKIKRISDLSNCHDNDFVLTMDGAALETISFDIKEHSVTAHQPYAGVKCSCVNGKGIITVLAGRHKSEEVASWFKTEVQAGKAIGCMSIDTFPEALNFAVKGTLTFTVAGETTQISNFMLAQGSFQHLVNNWWLGGPDMYGLQVPGAGGGVAQFSTPAKKLQLPKLVAWNSVLKAENQMGMQFLKNPGTEGND